MINLDPTAAALAAMAASPDRPASAVIHDTDDVRLVVFRLEQGQAVPPHTSVSSVVLTVLDGDGILSAASTERRCSKGDIVLYEPNELHGMRAEYGRMLLLATITPRPGSR